MPFAAACPPFFHLIIVNTPHSLQTFWSLDAEHTVNCQQYSAAANRTSQIQNKHMSSLDTSDPLPSTMNDDGKFYLLHIESAGVTGAWAASFPTNWSQEVYAEVELDQTVEKATRVVERNDIVIWNQDVPQLTALEIAHRLCRYQLGGAPPSPSMKTCA